MADQKTFGMGDVVRLKSGGPWITVSALAGESSECLTGSDVIQPGSVECVWFNKKSEVAVAVFPTACLVLPGMTSTPFP